MPIFSKSGHPQTGHLGVYFHGGFMRYLARYSKENSFFATDCQNSSDGSVDAIILNSFTRTWCVHHFASEEEYDKFTGQLPYVDDVEELLDTLRQNPRRLNLHHRLLNYISSPSESLLPLRTQPFLVSSCR